MQFLLANLPMFLVMAVLMLLERARNPARTDWLINLQAWALSAFVAINIQPLFQIAGLPSLLHGKDMPFWMAFPIFLLVGDFGEFLYHRTQHKVPFLWAMHSLHHSDPEMSVLTTQRHFWGDQLIKTVTIWAAATLVIAPTPAMVGAFVLTTLWNFFSHARLKVDLGRWSWVINTPAYHRRHHSRLPEHFDTNFAGLFPIFDVIFGSYRRPDGFPPTGYEHAPKNAADLALWPLRQGKRAEAVVTPNLLPQAGEG